MISDILDNKFNCKEMKIKNTIDMKNFLKHYLEWKERVKTYSLDNYWF